MSFANNDEILPSHELATMLGAEFEEQCKMLCDGTYPFWPEVRARLNELRKLL